MNFSLKDIFDEGIGRLRAVLSPSRGYRAFLVNSPEMRDEIVDMMEACENSFSKYFRLTLKRMSDDSADTDAATQAARERSMTLSSQGSERFLSIIGLQDWPDSLKDKDYSSLGTPGAGPAAILQGSNLYITVPTAAAIEKRYAAPEALAMLQAWQPPAGLTEVPASTLDRDAMGFPRVDPSWEQIEAFRHAPSADRAHT